ncbi:uncharacterized protein LOC125039293 [Penaeus chinensis]|uniref:uncharacterized protein LOC125039293 n=1 Tax=Penaeus chinensis TaxID=139456 RepID=UPI001FB83E10|nr:uncharacterized protein LOC125039293 [Penaeus chinensis]
MAGEDDIEYYFLKEDDFDEVVAFLAEDYFQREPITLGTHANEKCEPGKGRMGEDVRRCLKSGLSVGARDRKTGQLIGLRVSNLLDREKPFKSTQPCNEFEELYRIAEHVVNHVYEEKADKFLMMFLLSVHKDYGARGIAGEMVKVKIIFVFINFKTHLGLSVGGFKQFLLPTTTTRQRPSFPGNEGGPGSGGDQDCSARLLNISGSSNFFLQFKRYFNGGNFDVARFRKFPLRVPLLETVLYFKGKYNIEQVTIRAGTLILCNSRDQQRTGSGIGRSKVYIDLGQNKAQIP